MGRGKSRRSLELIEAAKDILREIQPATVRAVCYRLFTMKLITSMKPIETNRVGVQLKWARRRGVIPWAWIVDETREAEYGGGWEDPTAFAKAAMRSYRRDRWQTQPCRVEVWSEKGTVRGIMGPVLDTYQVTFRVMHGYGSETALHQVALEQRAACRPLLVLYVGDWDPSGLHMSEYDAPRRLLEHSVSEEQVKAWGKEAGPDLRAGMFRELLNLTAQIRLRRLALTEDDTSDGLPCFSASDKKHDPRYPWFLRTYGPACWELDALSPVVLRERVEAAILGEIDTEAWGRAGLGEKAEQKTLAVVLGKWQESISMQARR